MIRSREFPLDYFGVVASPLVNAMLNQSSNKRARKSAFNSLIRMMKSTKTIPANARPEWLGLTVDPAGQISLSLEYVVPDEQHQPL